MRISTEKRPDHAYSALWLYLARLHLSDEKTAHDELSRNQALMKTTWPGPIVAFYLGLIDEHQMLAKAGDNNVLKCEAKLYVRQWKVAHGVDEDIASDNDNPSACGNSKLE